MFNMENPCEARRAVVASRHFFYRFPVLPIPSPFFHHAFPAFLKREKRSAERALESRGEAFGRMRGCV